MQRWKVNIDEANEFLTDENNPKPSLILLDINLPRMVAVEFLKALNSDYLLKQIPVIVLISSEEDKDAARNYKIDAVDYILKPFSYKQFIEAIRALNIHWVLRETEENGDK